MALNPENPKDLETLRRLFIVKKVEGEMLKQRGYSLKNIRMYTEKEKDKPFSDQPISLENLQLPNYPLANLLQFRQTTGFFQNRQNFSSIYEHTDPNVGHILVLYLLNDPGKEVSTTHYKIVPTLIATQKFHKIILITETGLNSTCMSSTKRCAGYEIEVFLDEELAFNHLKFALCPISIKHVLSSQIAAWSAEENIKSGQLPLILDSDLVAKWYKAKPYDVFQYVIMGSNTDTAGYYRVVRQTPSERR